MNPIWLKWKNSCSTDCPSSSLTSSRRTTRAITRLLRLSHQSSYYSMIHGTESIFPWTKMNLLPDGMGSSIRANTGLWLSPRKVFSWDDSTRRRSDKRVYGASSDFDKTKSRVLDICKQISGYKYKGRYG